MTGRFPPKSPIRFTEMRSEGYHETAVAEIVSLCRAHPGYFATAASDADLECLRDKLAQALDELAAHAASTARHKFGWSVKKVKHTESLEKGAVLARALKEVEEFLSHKTYSDCLKAVRVCDAIDDLADAVNINATHKKEHNRAEDAWRLYGFFPWIHRIRFRRSLLGSGRDLWKVGGDKYLRMVSRERVGSVGDIAPFLGCLVSAEHT